MSDGQLVFGVNGCVVKLASHQVDPRVKLVEFLRGFVPPAEPTTTFAEANASGCKAALTGTKSGCDEGGCGACTVLVSWFDVVTKRVVSVSANACLRSVATLHGCHVTTVEGLGSSAKPHALQRRFHTMSASQCGFCTPGFVMSVYAQFARDPKSTVADMEASIDGNLCRCTGYRPILDAAKSFAVDHHVVDNLNGGAELPPSDGIDAQAEIEAIFPAELKGFAVTPALAPEGAGQTRSAGAPSKTFHGGALTHVAAESLAEVVDAFRRAPGARIVCAQTSSGVYKDDLPNAAAVIDVSRVAELRGFAFDASTGLRVGSTTTISELAGHLLRAAAANAGTAQAYRGIVEQITKIAGFQVRNVGSITGNLVMCRELGFASDLATPLCAAGARIEVLRLSEKDTGIVVLPLIEFLSNSSAAAQSLLRNDKQTYVVVSVSIPAFTVDTVFRCYRTAIRIRNAHAILNGGFTATRRADGRLDVAGVYGIVGDIDVPYRNGPQSLPAVRTTTEGATLETIASVVRAHGGLQVPADFVRGSYKASHRRLLVKSFFDKFVDELPTLYDAERSARATLPLAAVHETKQTFEAVPVAESKSASGIHQSTPRPDGALHSTGQALYPSDIAERKGTVHAAWVVSTVAGGTLSNVPVEAIAAQPGFIAFVDHRTIQAIGASNNIDCPVKGLPLPGAQEDQLVFAESAITCMHQRIGLVVAETRAIAIRLADMLTAAVVYTAAPAVTNIDAAIAAEAAGTQKPWGEFAHKKGDYEAVAGAAKAVDGSAGSALSAPSAKVNATVRMPTQLHFYMETHASYAYADDDRIVVHCSSQWPELVHRGVAAGLKRPMCDVRVVQMRIGGSFGAKVHPVHGIAAAVASVALRRPVKMHLPRHVDSCTQGGRPEKKFQVEAVFDPATKAIQGIDMTVHLGQGYKNDLGDFLPFVTFPRSAIHAYRVPNFKGHYVSHRTAYINRCPVRSPGEIETAYLAEEINDRIAFACNVHPHEVRAANLANVDDTDARGQGFHAEDFTLRELWDDAVTVRGWKERIAAVERFNTEHKWVKRGVAITPFVYHLSTQEGNVVVTGYSDGTFCVSHGGVEMGQGLAVKVQQAVISELCTIGPVKPEHVRCIGNDSHVVPHGMCTGGSVGSESNVEAARRAAQNFVEKVRPILGALPEQARAHWPTICMASRFMGRVDMTGIGTLKGLPKVDQVEYAVYSLGATEVEVDVRTGEVSVDRFDLIYDCAKSLNPAVDIGQAEGALVMGLGHMLQEHAGFDAATGAILHPTTWEYKIPIARDLPKTFNVVFHPHKGTGFHKGIMTSKASGEPPLCVAAAVVSAVRQAVIAARREHRSAADAARFPDMEIPLRPDEVARAIHIA